MGSKNLKAVAIRGTYGKNRRYSGVWTGTANWATGSLTRLETLKATPMKLSTGDQIDEFVDGGGERPFRACQFVQLSAPDVESPPDWNLANLPDPVGGDVRPLPAVELECLRRAGLAGGGPQDEEDGERGRERPHAGDGDGRSARGEGEHTQRTATRQSQGVPGELSPHAPRFLCFSVLHGEGRLKE